MKKEPSGIQNLSEDPVCQKVEVLRRVPAYILVLFPDFYFFQCHKMLSDHKITYF